MFCNCQLFCAVAWNRFFFFFLFCCCCSLWKLKAGRQRQPWVAVRPLVSFCPSVQVQENYFQLRLCGATDVCNVFHLLPRHFCFISWAPSLWRSATRPTRLCLCVCVCVRVFCLLWAGFRSLFLFSALPLKENPLGFYKRSVPWALTACPDRHT